jgi:hypothetical protein
MSTDGNQGEGAGAGSSGYTKQRIEVSVESKSTEELLARLKTEEDARKKAEKDRDDALAAKKTADDAAEVSKTEAESHRQKLQMIAEREFAKKKTTITDKAKALIKDPNRLNLVLGKMESPEDLQATEFMLDTLQNAVETGRAETETIIKNSKADLVKSFPASKDAIEGAKTMEDLERVRNQLVVSGKGTGTGTGAAGTVPLSNQQAQGSQKSGGYDSYEAMIRDLRRRERSSNPEEAAEAKAVLDELFKKWTVAVKKEYEGKSTSGINVEPAKQQTIKEITGQKEAQEQTLSRKGVASS